MNLHDALPAELRRPGTTIEKVGVGLSGAGVYRVTAGDATYILKVAADAAPLEEWRRRLHVQRLTSAAGLGPRIVHVDEERRAIVTAFVADRGFPMYYRDPRTHDDALASLGRMMRRMHEIPLPPGTPAKDPREFLAAVWSGVEPSFRVPGFVAGAVRQVLDEPPPPNDRPLVLSHNDPNPTNLVYDGERLLLLDWDAAGANDPYFDLAAVAVFLRMDQGTVLRLLSAYEGAPVKGVPARFTWNRRAAAVMCGTAALCMGPPEADAGEAGEETLEATMGLLDFYMQMRPGGLTLATAAGRRAFGLALVKEGLAV